MGLCKSKGSQTPTNQNSDFNDQPRITPVAKPPVTKHMPLRVIEVEKPDAWDPQKAIFQQPKDPDYFCGLRNSVSGEKIHMTDVSYNIDIMGYAAYVEYICVFKNDLSKSDAEEVIFNFPLQCREALFDFRAELNGQLVIAAIKGKEAAKKEYQRAVEAKKTAALLSEENDYSEVFEIKLGALPQGETIRLSYSIAKELDTVGAGNNVFQFTSRLNRGYTIDEMGRVDAMQRQATDQEEQDQEQEMMISVDSMSEIVSENKEVFEKIDQNGDGCTYYSKSDKGLDDVRLKIWHDGHDETMALIEPGRIYPGGFLGSSVAMLHFKTEMEPDASISVSEEFIFIVDRSESMKNGDLMSSAIKTVEIFLLSLPHTSTGCYFNIVSFGSTYQFMWEKSQPCTVYNLKKAFQIVKGFCGEFGGTNLIDPLKWAMGTQSTFKKRYVIVITDGKVDNTDDVISYCDRKRQDNTIWAFGIGPDADTKLVKGVGDEKFGLMTSSTGLKNCVQLAMDGAHTDFYRNIDVEFKMPKLFSVSKVAAPSVLIPGSNLVVFAEIEYRGRDLRLVQNDVGVEGGTCEITFTKPDGEKDTLKLDIKLAVRQRYDSLLEPLEGNQILFCELLSFVEMGLPIHRLAAKRNILAWSVEKGMESKIEALSIEANVLSPVTSFVAVIDGEDVFAEGRKTALEFPRRSENYSHVRPEMCIVEDGSLPSSLDDERGMESSKLPDDVENKWSEGTKGEKASNTVEAKSQHPISQCISNADLEEFQMFAMVYSTCFSRLRTKYSFAEELVKATDLHREVLKLGINQNEWASFIKQRLTKITIVLIWDGTEYKMKVNAYGRIDELISSICKKLSITEDQIGDIKVGKVTLIPTLENKRLVELGLRNGTKLSVNTQ